MLQSPIKTHAPQMEIWRDESRFKVIVAGRRLGKTFLMREKLLSKTEKSRSFAAYVAPTRLQAKSIMWDSLKDRVRQLGWRVTINESELKITRSNKSRIQLFSAEKPNRMRGMGYDFVGFDEYAEYRSNEIWDQVVRAALSDKRGQAWFVGTPKGFNHLYELYNKAKTEIDWANFQYKTLDSPFFQTEEGRVEIESARSNLTDRDFKQEYEASFENFAGRIYYAFDREKNHEPIEYDKDLPIIMGNDFNRNPMTACLFQKHGSRLLQFDEVFLMGSDTPELCRVVKQRYPKAVAYIARPDATGSRTYTVNKNLSDHVILREHGFKIEASASNPSRVDRWASVNRGFEKKWIAINVKKCPKTVKDLEVMSYKEGSCEPLLTDPLLGHQTDGFGYAVNIEFPIIGKATQSYY